MAEALVIGGNGFIGSHLVDALVRAGHRVRVLDRFSRNVRRFTASGVQEFRGALQDRSLLAEALDGVELVFHFVSNSTPASAASFPAEEVFQSIGPSVDLMELAVQAGIQHLYFASTGGAIYGNQPQTVFRETDATMPISPYAISKATIEDYLRFYRVARGLSSTVFRISNPYGPRQFAAHGQGLIPLSLRRIAAHVPVVQYGDGEMVRDYIFIDDLIEMLMQIVERGSSRYDTYNLGSGQGVSVREVFATLTQVCGPYEFNSEPAPPSFVDSVVLDISRFVEEFGRPEFTPLQTGIEQTVAAWQAGEQ